MAMNTIAPSSTAVRVTPATAARSSTALRAMALGKGFFKGDRALCSAPRMPTRPVQARRNVGVQALFGGTAVDNKTFYDFTVTDIDGKRIDLAQYKGKVVLVVNVASQCGFTPQYKSLQSVFSKYSKDGLVVLAFPCNQFGGQEPGSNSEIKSFAARQGATFPVMAKVDVNGANADPLYGFLKAKQGGLLTSDIKWNFTKFLVDRNGSVVKRYGSTTTPDEIEADIKQFI